MRQLAILTIFAIAVSTFGASSASAQSNTKLIVAVVVDQIRADYIDRYDAYFSGGFRRLSDEGISFDNAWVDHAYTNSLPGHATAMTGAYPRRHGITDNVWHQPSVGKDVVASGFSLVDRRDGAPYDLGALTLGEHVLASRPSSRFAAVGANNASRIYAGQLRGSVFWFDASAGFVTNSNYAASSPEWLDRFNAELIRTYAKGEWTSSIPGELAARLRADASLFENRGEDVAFPHRAPQQSERPLDWFANTPMRDEAALRVAAKLVDQGLGRGEGIDVLSISLTSLDEIGHAYGPFSHEQTDALLRLDKALGAFMAHLDRTVGKGQWLFALTGDHGVATTPEQLRLWGSIEGHRVSREEAAKAADAAHAAYAMAADPKEAAKLAADALEQFDFVAAVYTEEEVAAFEPANGSIEGLLALSYVPGRIPAHPFYIREKALAELGVFVVLKEDVMMDWATAIHGSQYDYDRRVPFYFLGAGIVPGRRASRAGSVDLVPTILDLVGVLPASELDGKTLVPEMSIVR